MLYILGLGSPTYPLPKESYAAWASTYEWKSSYGYDYLYAGERQFFDYLARGVAYGPDDGTLGPWAVVASLPFAPEIVLPAIDYLVHEVDLKKGHPYGFKATFNPTYPDKSGNPYGWVSPWHYGINQGPINPMRKLSNGFVVALDAGLPLRRHRVAASGFHGRLVTIRLVTILSLIAPR